MELEEKERRREIVKYCIEKSMLETLRIKGFITKEEYEDIKNDIDLSYEFYR